MALTEVGTANSPTGGRPASASRDVNALADGPDFLFAGQSIQRLGDKIRQHIIELADESLIRAEDDGAHRLRSRAWPSGLLGGGLPASSSRQPGPAPRCDHSPPAPAPTSHIVRCSRPPGPSSSGPRIPDRPLRRSCGASLPRYRSWLPLGFGNGFWLERRDRFADDLQNRFAVLVAQLVVRGKALDEPRPGCPRPPFSELARHPAPCRSAHCPADRRSTPRG